MDGYYRGAVYMNRKNILRATGTAEDQVHKDEVLGDRQIL